MNDEIIEKLDSYTQEIQNKENKRIKILMNLVGNNEKITDWKNEPDLASLQNDLTNSREYHSRIISRIEKWNNAKNAIGEYSPPNRDGRSKVQPKLIRKQAEWKLPNLKEPFLENYKLFQVQPRSYGDLQAAQQNETILNYQFDTQINKVAFIDEYVNTAADDGTVIVRIGWDKQFNIIKEEIPIFAYFPLQQIDQEQLQQLQNTLPSEQLQQIQEEQELIQQIQQAMDTYQDNPNAFNMLDEELKESALKSLDSGMPIKAVISGSEIIEKEQVLKNAPNLTIVDPNCFYIDPTCRGNIDNAKFVIHSYETTIAELKRKNIYKNLDKISIMGDTVDGIANKEDSFTQLGSTATMFQFNDEPRKKITVYEYWGFWDIDGDGSNLKPIVANWVGQTLIRLEENPFPNGKYPFVVVPFIPLRKEIYGESDAELIIDNQQIIGAVTRGCIDLLGRSANGQIGMPDDFLDPENQDRFNKGEDFCFPGDIENPSNQIWTPSFPEISQSAIQILQMQQNDAESLTGQSAFNEGLNSSAYGQVATGIKGVISATAKREMSILRRLANGIKQIGEKIIALNSIMLTKENTIRITNEEYIQVNPDNLIGNFDLTVDISTIDMDNQKASDLSFMLQTLGNTVPFDITKLLLIELARLKRMPELAHSLSNYQQQPDPVQQKLQELQVAQLQAQIDNLNAKAENLKAKTTEISPELSQLSKQSEIEVNKAKAKSLDSDADLKDLDFHRTASGEKHQQQLEEQKAQAEGNQNLEVTKSLLNSQTHPTNLEAAIGFNTISNKLSANNQNDESLPDNLSISQNYNNGINPDNGNSNLINPTFKPPMSGFNQSKPFGASPKWTNL